MRKNNKVVKRTAGIPISVSLEPRPNFGIDLASDIFDAVKKDQKEKNKKREEPAQSIEAISKKTTIKQENVKSSNFINSVNSIIKQTPLERLFEKSKAKELYDILINLTHKSETPTDKVRVPRSYLMANTNIKTRITLDQNLKRLENLGLIKITSIVGEQEGNLYQVYLQEN
jgi:hypothetical protein